MENSEHFLNDQLFDLYRATRDRLQKDSGTTPDQLAALPVLIVGMVLRETIAKAADSIIEAIGESQ